MSNGLRIEIISIGDELLTGHISNTNGAWIADRLLQMGLRVRRMVTVGDNSRQIIDALQQVQMQADHVIVTGGLGPTHDDVTRQAVCEFFHSPLALNLEVLEDIKAFFRRRGMPMARLNEDQARVPVKARLIRNDSGTAPGYIFDQQDTRYYFLPGVPHEMRSMMERVVLNELKPLAHTRVVQTRFLCTIGIAESALFEKIGNIDVIDPRVRIAFLPGFSGVKIRLLTEAEDEKSAKERLAEAVAYVRRNIEAYIYAEEDMPLEQALARKLTAKSRTIAIAESCSGGSIADKITNIPGSSKFFERGVVTYSNEAKIQLLGVPADLMATHGAVSEQVAGAMAEGVRRLSGVDYGLSTTGIAGPGGGNHKPVGLVFVGCASKKGLQVRKHTFIGDRLANKERFAYAALQLLWENLRDEEG